MSDDFEHLGSIKAHFARHRNGWHWRSTDEGPMFANDKTGDIFTVVIPGKRIISVVGVYEGQAFRIVDNNPKKVVKRLIRLFS